MSSWRAEAVELDDGATEETRRRICGCVLFRKQMRNHQQENQNQADRVGPSPPHGSDTEKKIWSAQTVTMQCPRLNPSYKPVTVQHCVSTFVRVTSLGVSTRRRVETQHDVCAWTRTSILQNTGCVSGQFKMTTFILMNSSSTRDVRQSLWVGSVNTFRYITVFHEVYKWDGTAVLKARLPPHAAGFISSWTDESESKYNKYKKPRSQPASSIFNWSNNVTEAESLLVQLRWDRVRMRFLWTESTQNHEKCQ